VDSGPGGAAGVSALPGGYFLLSDKSIEGELKTPGHSTDDAVARLDRLEERANQLRLPVAFAQRPVAAPARNAR